MPDGQDALYKGAQQVGAGLGMLATIPARRRQYQLAQQQRRQQAILEQKKQQFTEAKSKLDIAIKLMDKASSNEERAFYYNQMFVPSAGVLFPNVQVGQVQEMDDPTANAMKTMIKAYDPENISALGQALPAIYQYVAENVPKPAEAIEQLQQIAQPFLPGAPRTLDVGQRRVEAQVVPATGLARPIQVQTPQGAIPAVSPKGTAAPTPSNLKADLLRRHFAGEELNPREQQFIASDLRDPYVGTAARVVFADPRNLLKPPEEQLDLMNTVTNALKAFGTQESQAAPGTPVPPKVGEIRNGFKFKGGNPADPKNWQKVK